MEVILGHTGFQLQFPNPGHDESTLTSLGGEEGEEEEEEEADD